MKKDLPFNGMQYRTGATYRTLHRDIVDAMPVAALTFLASNPDRLGRFFDITGLTFQTLRQAAQGRGFGSSILDYLGSDENLLRAFAAENGYDPADVDAARMALGGGPHADA